MTLEEFDKLPKMYVLCFGDNCIAVFEDYEEAVKEMHMLADIRNNWKCKTPFPIPEIVHVVHVPFFKKKG